LQHFTRPSNWPVWLQYGQPQRTGRDSCPCEPPFPSRSPFGNAV